MQIPDYLAKAIFAHYKRIVENTSCDRRDTRTRNALRLARQELRKLNAIIKTVELNDKDEHA